MRHSGILRGMETTEIQSCMKKAMWKSLWLASSIWIRYYKYMYNASHQCIGLCTPGSWSKKRRCWKSEYVQYTHTRPFSYQKKDASVKKGCQKGFTQDISDPHQHHSKSKLNAMIFSQASKKKVNYFFDQKVILSC